MRSFPKHALVAVGVLLAGLSAAATPDGTSLLHGFSLEAGVGYDTNPYLAPDQPYYDQNHREIVTPVKQPGMFFPLRLRGSLELPLAGGHSFVTDYRILGDFYADEATRNADEAFIKLEPGFLFDLDGATRKNRFLEVRGYASYNRDLYFDRDTGVPVTTEGIDVSNRFNYRAIGGELGFDYEFISLVRLYLNARAERRDYEETEVVDPFDQNRFRADGGVVLDFSRKVELSLNYRYEIRDYLDRHARSLDGDDEPINPKLRYVLNSFRTTLRLRPWRPWMLDLIVERLNREDAFIHYNDYTQDTYRIRSRLHLGRVEWRLYAKFWQRDFERAYVFDDPINPRNGDFNFIKFYETYDITSELHVPLKRHFGIVGAVDFINQRTTDPRFDYERLQIRMGIEVVY